MNKNYQICTRCIMDTTAANITFDNQGVCNFCTEFLNRAGSILFKDPQTRRKELDAFVEEVKSRGKRRQYDCIVGVSGGVDSSWTLVQAVKLGLRPLAVHMDNGWNSELAQNNISNLVQKLGVDLYTYVIEWDEYRSLMQSFFDADVIDVELLYDNAMLSVNYRNAAKYGVKFILSGSNEATEGMRMPLGWSWFKRDKLNIESIGATFGNIKLKSFPAYGTYSEIWFKYFLSIQWVSFLDYFEYNKELSLSVLQKEYGYKPYPYKHYESVFTRFYQGYILPQKFGVDKRKLHYSTLIASRQMSREDAINQLDRIAYPSQRALDDDKTYFLKKMGWTPEQLEMYINRPAQPHLLYGSERDSFKKAVRRVNKVIKLKQQILFSGK